MGVSKTWGRLVPDHGGGRDAADGAAAGEGEPVPASQRWASSLPQVFDTPDARGTVEGMLTRYNRKSVTVITDDGRQWNVSPALLSRAAVPSAAEPQARPNLVCLK